MQHTFKNDMRIQLSLSLHFYLLRLLLSSCALKIILLTVFGYFTYLGFRTRRRLQLRYL